jgi:hypothetical protein
MSRSGNLRGLSRSVRSSNRFKTETEPEPGSNRTLSIGSTARLEHGRVVVAQAHARDIVPIAYEVFTELDG